MSTILMALSLGAISMIIVFVSGLASGVVRFGTLTMRSCFAFCLASAACYFLLMLFDMYEEWQQKRALKLAEEAVEGGEGENSEEGSRTDTENLPDANN